MRLAIIDTGLANLASLDFALRRLGKRPVISRDLAELGRADKLFLPGVGAAPAAMRSLAEAGLLGFLREMQRPLLGICLGMQLLGTSSEEVGPGQNSPQEGLGVLAFETRHFSKLCSAESPATSAAAHPASAATAESPPAALPLPHMGWNEVFSSHPLFAGLGGAYFYFVHSFAVGLCEATIARCDYGVGFSAALSGGNFYGVQFHPERSGEAGQALLANFLKI